MSKHDQYTSFVGSGVQVYGAMVLALALELYDKHKIKPNRAFTPKGMIAKAQAITGRKFRARDYAGAAKAVRAWIAEEKPRAIKRGDIS